MDIPVKMEKKRKNRKRKLSEVTEGTDENSKQTKTADEDVKMAEPSGEYERHTSRTTSIELFSFFIRTFQLPTSKSLLRRKHRWSLTAISRSI